MGGGRLVCYITGRIFVGVSIRWAVAWVITNVINVNGPKVLAKRNGRKICHEKNPGCLGCIGDYTTQVYRDYNKPL